MTFKIKDLIEELQKCDPNGTVSLHVNHYINLYEIEEIEAFCWGGRFI